MGDGLPSLPERKRRTQTQSFCSGSGAEGGRSRQGGGRRCVSLKRARRAESEGDKWKNFLSAMVEKALGILSEKAEACL